MDIISTSNWATRSQYGNSYRKYLIIKLDLLRLDRTLRPVCTLVHLSGRFDPRFRFLTPSRAQNCGDTAPRLFESAAGLVQPEIIPSVVAIL